MIDRERFFKYLLLALVFIVNALTLSEALAFHIWAPSTGEPTGGGKVIYSRSTWNINNQAVPVYFQLVDTDTLNITVNGNALVIDFPDKNAGAVDTYTATEIANAINDAFTSGGIDAKATVVDSDYGVGTVRVTAGVSVYVTGTGGNANTRVNGLDFKNEGGEQDPMFSSGSGAASVSPVDLPPFTHWDLRRFTGNKIPYSVNNAGINDDTTPAGAVGQVTAAFNSWEAVSPSLIGFAAQPDTTGAGYDPGGVVQKDGWNILDWQTEAEAPYVVGGSAITGVWIDVANNTGRIVEADVIFNNSLDWTDKGMDWTVVPGQYDIQGVAAHEIGHFIGLGHEKDSVTTSTAATMSYDLKIWEKGTELRSLATDDQNGANFLYSPDHGDAPDPYPVKVHGAASGEKLNNIALLNPGPGATHLFGYRPGYSYEWLGPDVDEAADEGEAKQIDRDKFDDGVKITGTIASNSRLKVEVTVTTKDEGNHTGSRYLNAWFDWNSDGVWDESEHAIGNAAGAEAFTGSGAGLKTETRTYDVTATVQKPYGPGKPIWARFRLDYKEDAGQVDKIDNTLNLATGAAQFGEVEDYNLYVAYQSWEVTYTTGNYKQFENTSTTGSKVDGYTRPGNIPIYTSNPHGGYSTTSNKCKTCHAVHNATGSFKLLPQATSSDDACDYCHLGAAAHTNKLVYGYASDDPEILPTAVNNGHTIGESLANTPDTESVSASGILTCNVCHSVHGAGVILFNNSPTNIIRAAPLGGAGVTDSASDYGISQGTVRAFCLKCHDANSGSDSHPYSIADNNSSWGNANYCLDCHAASGRPHAAAQNGYKMLIGRDDTSNASANRLDDVCRLCHINATSDQGVGLTF